MRNLKNSIGLIFFVSVIIMSLSDSCKKDVVEPIIGQEDSIAAANVKIDKWIHETMATYYYWEASLPEYNSNISDDPKTYYKGLLNEEDHWSYITDNYVSLSSELNGTPYSMGYSPAFYLYNNSENVLIVVEFVYPGSPADLGGLKRGDIILTIDGVMMDTTNYYDLYSGSSYQVELAEINSQSGNLQLNGASITMVAAIVEADPSIYHDVIQIEDKKIGYLVFTGFTGGDGNKYLTTLDNIFDEFKANSVTDLIVDLRYNGGGAISVAGHLASAIAPVSSLLNSSVLVEMDYNQLLTDYYTTTEGQNSANLVYKFPANSHNLNMSTVYFLGTGGTASASELLISGLRPYMNSVLIGEPTYGKYTGMFVIPDDDDVYAIMPVVLKYKNAEGYTDFADGLTPDYEVEDDLIGAVPFGNLSDPMLAQAIEVITGNLAIAVKSSVRKTDFQKFEPLPVKLKKNLFVDHHDLTVNR